MFSKYQKVKTYRIRKSKWILTRFTTSHFTVLLVTSPAVRTAASKSMTTTETRCEKSAYRRCLIFLVFLTVKLENYGNKYDLSQNQTE